MAIKLISTGVWQDRDQPTAELYDAVAKREQRVVASSSDVAARFKRGAALSHDNRAALGELSAAELDAAILRIAVASVSGRTLSLFMCHDTVSF